MLACARPCAPTVALPSQASTHLRVTHYERMVGRGPTPRRPEVLAHRHEAGRLPYALRAAEQEALSEFDTELEQGLGLRPGLDSLGQQLRIGLRREVDHAGDQRLTGRVPVDAAHHGDVELDQVRPQLQ